MQGHGVTRESGAMTDAWGNLHIDVVDDEIIVTLPLTSYTVTYYKPTNSPQLLAKRIANKDDELALATVLLSVQPSRQPSVLVTKSRFDFRQSKRLWSSQ